MTQPRNTLNKDLAYMRKYELSNGKYFNLILISKQQNFFFTKRYTDFPDLQKQSPEGDQ